MYLFRFFEVTFIRKRKNIFYILGFSKKKNPNLPSSTFYLIKTEARGILRIPTYNSENGRTSFSTYATNPFTFLKLPILRHLLRRVRPIDRQTFISNMIVYVLLISFLSQINGFPQRNRGRQQINR